MTAPLRLLEDGTCSVELRRALTQLPTAPAISPAVHGKMIALTAHLVKGGVSAVAFGTATTAAQGAVFGKALSGYVAVKLVMHVVLGTALLTAFGTVGYLVTDRVMTTNSSQPLSLRVSANTAEGPSAPLVPAFTAKTRENITVEPEAKLRPSGVTEIAKTAVTSTPTEELRGEPVGLTREARILEAARSVLVSDPAQALEITQEHGSFFPRGQLSDERELIATDALLRLGRRNEAWQRAEPRLLQSPKSLYAKRLRQLFGIREFEE